MKKKHSIWSAAPLRWKVGGWFAAMMTVMALILGSMVLIGQTTFHAFERTQQRHMAYYAMQDALETEYNALDACLQEDSAANRQTYELARDAAFKAMEALPFEYEDLGEDRFARTRELRQGYEDYCSARDALLAADPSDPSYGEKIDDVLQMQHYLSEYALLLVQATIEQNNEAYQVHAALYEALPWLYLGLMLVAIGALGALVHQFSATVIDPMLELSEASRVLADNDFSGEDLPVRTSDELGDLTRAFNHMKHAMAGHIATLEEKNRMAQQLHKEELAREALKQHLSHIQLAMLRSQVDPHFLFNTLNMISCMAQLEDAADTEKMILRLSALFRYNLRTQAQEVTLKDELGVLDDYLYLQQMRFDGRVTCRTILRVDPARVRIPSFTLQPVVENAFNHGLKSMEDGGRITLRIWQEENNVIVSIADNGRGMTPEELEALHAQIAADGETGQGIGLGNICRRIQLLYPVSGGFRIHSRPGRGTVVQLIIPQRNQ